MLTVVSCCVIKVSLVKQQDRLLFHSSVMICKAPFCSVTTKVIFLPLGQRIDAFLTVVPTGIPKVVLIGACPRQALTGNRAR